ncbi:hypothetical protein K435DRAFT_974722 [Dendrothele bispora CBS 962.96]|uniref:Uncharacterized protein n=1 Tax=Dendrothele bispora (strain CBS 962.96) TaxID=1314807 RepID=A0A4S8KJN8_DENBC|nr:hypothetical protein K435DRAFT_974722 [Dendrothele bispora CBS 962.96]
MDYFLQISRERTTKRTLFSAAQTAMNIDFLFESIEYTTLSSSGNSINPVHLSKPSAAKATFPSLSSWYTLTQQHSLMTSHP